MPSKNIPVKSEAPIKFTPAVQHVRDTQDRLWGKGWRKKQTLVDAHALGGDNIKFHYR